MNGRKDFVDGAVHFLRPQHRAKLIATLADVMPENSFFPKDRRGAQDDPIIAILTQSRKDRNVLIMAFDSMPLSPDQRVRLRDAVLKSW